MRRVLCTARSCPADSLNGTAADTRAVEKSSRRMSNNGRSSFHSEHQPKSKLHLSRRSNTSYFSEIRIVKNCNGSVEDRCVRRVESFRPQLQLKIFMDRENTKYGE